MAFGLGTKEVAGQVAAGQCLRRILHRGETVRYDRYEGTVQEVGLTHVILGTTQGLVTIPNTLVMNATLIKLAPQNRSATCPEPPEV